MGYPLKDREVVIEAKYKLAGTLSVPGGISKKVPGVLFIHGSGPVDRNENVKGIAINAFKYLAEDLTQLGFATLRYDKRGIGKSEGNHLETGLWDLVDDAEQALKFLKSQPEVAADKIILIGHSEGCVIAPALNARLAVQGMVLLAGIVGGVFDASQYQIDQVFREIKEMKGLKGFMMRLLVNEKKARPKNDETLKKLFDSDKDIVKIKGRKVNAKWMREQKAFVVDPVLAKAECPILAITGSKDIQVHPEDAKRMGEIVKSPFEYHIIPDMNHLLRNQPEPPSILKIKKIYKKSVKKPLDPELIDVLNKWIVKI